MRRALITGSAGFIGRHMVSHLRQARWTVFECDLNGMDGRDCRDVFAEDLDGLDLLVHCAALVNGRETIDGQPARLLAYNLALDAAMFDFALRARPSRVVYLSSSAAYPTSLQVGSSLARKWTPVGTDTSSVAWREIRSRPLQEHVPCLANAADNTYGYVKVVGEHLAEHARAAGVPVTVVRPFSGYGTDQDACYPFRAMLERAMRHDSPFDVWGDGIQVRDFVHVDDICNAILALVDAGIDGPVNIGTGTALSMDQLAYMMMRAAGYVAPIRHLSDKPSGVGYRVADTSLLNRYYTPQVTLKDAIGDALA